MANKQNGYIIISDITGYTSYLKDSELEHAEDVLRSLLNTIIEYTKLPLVISRLEGDAVISYAPERSILQGQTVIEMMETCYVAFRRAIELMILNTSCTCNACKNISKLDLKFFVHYGTFMLQQFPGYTELIGTDVNLAHRLTKNHVTEETGLKAYALYTQATVDALELSEWPPELMKHTEKYDDVGEVTGYIQDLHALWEEYHERDRIVLEPEDALAIIAEDFPLNPVQMWDYVTKPEYKAIHAGADSATMADRKHGRFGVGSSYQCYHGDELIPQLVLDWQPFDQYSYEARRAPLDLLATVKLVPVEAGTRLLFLGKIDLVHALVTRLLRPILRAIMTRDVRRNYAALRAQIEKDIEAGVLFRPEAAEINLEEIGKSIREKLAAAN